MNNHSWTIRLAEPNELDFIYATWLNNFRNDSTIGKSCRKSVFFSEYPYVLDQLLDRPLTKVIVAASKENPELILAYLVYELDQLHYCFTKEIYRGLGIMKSLFEKAFEKRERVQITHRTYTIEPLLEKHKNLFHFNPFKLYHLGGEKNV